MAVNVLFCIEFDALNTNFKYLKITFLRKTTYFVQVPTQNEILLTIGNSTNGFLFGKSRIINILTINFADRVTSSGTLGPQ